MLSTVNMFRFPTIIYNNRMYYLHVNLHWCEVRVHECSREALYSTVDISVTIFGLNMNLNFVELLRPIDIVCVF